MWQQIIGHDRVVELFQRSLVSGRLASSYLFLGPAGIGKRTFALKLTKALLCTASPETVLEACDSCESCRLMDAGSHPDVDVVGLPPGKRELPISTFLGDKDHRHQEGLCHNLGLRPKMGRRRVAIIDDADGLNTESANCLLKTLEEPPQGAMLILIGTNRSRQLPTILSRTQIVRFESLSPDDLSCLIVTQGVVGDAAEARELAIESHGSLQRANEILAMNLTEFRPQLVSAMSSTSIDAMRIVAVITDFIGKAGAESDARRQRLRAAIDIVTEHFQRQLRDVEGQFSTNRARESRLLAILDRCVLAEEELDRNANLSTLVECWIDDIAEAFGRVTAPR